MANDNNLEQLIQEYQLTKEEHSSISRKISEIFFKGKTKPKIPTAIFTIGPPGSGKTGLNGLAQKELNGNLVIVNNDELRPFHPKAEEIAKKHPKEYIKITNEESKYWTDELVDKTIEEGYNILYEGTGRKIEIFKRMIEKMLQRGYIIIIKAMAVNELNCLMSIVERYAGQVQHKGWGRIVSIKTFYKSYDAEMIETIDTLENEGEISEVEVYIRSDEPTNPIKIYSTSQKQYKDAKTAIIKGRKLDKINAIKYYEQYFKRSKLKDKETEEILERMEEIHKHHKTIDDMDYNRKKLK